jgi:hypothetical protein
VLRRKDSFFYANKLRHVWSYLQTRERFHRMKGTPPAAAQLATFAGAYWRKRAARKTA